MVLAEDLRQAVLQAALQGKLTEQLETDSDVGEMLKHIALHREELKECKNALNLSAMDIEIPDSWRMVELNSILSFVDYRGKTPNKIEKGIFLIRASNIKKGYMDYTRKEYISEEEYKMRQSRGITNRGDLLFTTEAPLGNVALCDLDITSCGQRIITMKAYCENTVCLELFMYFILSSAFQNELLDNCTGTTAKGIKADKLKHLLIPLPPIEEQQRIVDKINEIMPKIDEYEKIEKELEALKKEFPNNMKDALLQAAMQGKLTEQLESDCSVISIIEQCEKDKEEAIKEGKYKKEKFRGALCEEEYPFDIPDNWKWLYISDMSLFQEGPGILAVDFRIQGVPLIRIAGMQEDVVKLDGCNYLDPQMVEDKWKHFKLDLGDIVISTSASMDKIAEVTEETVGAIPYTGLIRFKMFGNINKEYFKYFIKSSFYATQINEQKSGGTIKHYGPTHLKKMLIPIPPIEEQQRIVERLEALLPLCETLKE